MSKKIDEIIEKLKEINLLEASELVKKIEDTFGVDTSASFQSLNNSSSVITKEQTSEIEEKTEFDVIIEKVETAKRLTVIKVIRTLTSLGLKEAKEIIESLPKVLLQSVPKEKGEEAKKLLEEAGASISMK